MASDRIFRIRFPKVVPDCYMCAVGPYLTYQYVFLYLFKIECPHEKGNANNPKISSSNLRMFMYFLSVAVILPSWIILTQNLLFSPASIKSLKLSITQFCMETWVLILSSNAMFMRKSYLASCNRIAKLIQKRKNFAIETILPSKEVRRVNQIGVIFIVSWLIAPTFGVYEYFFLENELSASYVFGFMGIHVSSLIAIGYCLYQIINLKLYMVILKMFSKHVITQFERKREEIKAIENRQRQYLRLPQLSFKDNVCLMEKFYISFCQNFCQNIIGLSSIVFATFNFATLLVAAVSIHISAFIFVASSGASLNYEEFVNAAICIGIVSANAYISWVGNALVHANDELISYLYRYPTLNLHQHEILMVEHFLMTLNEIPTRVNVVDIFNLENSLSLSIEAEIITFSLCALQYHIFEI